MIFYNKTSQCQPLSGTIRLMIPLLCSDFKYLCTVRHEMLVLLVISVAKILELVLTSFKILLSLSTTLLISLLRLSSISLMKNYQ